MQKNKVKIIFLNFLKLCVTFFLIFYCAKLIEAQFKDSLLKRINYFMPHSYTTLLDINEGRTEYNSLELQEADYYFKLVAKHFHRQDAFYMWGFTQYYLGHKAKSISCFEKALELDPHFFWTHYNLGVLYYQSGQYAKASDILKKALSSDPQETIKKMLLSKVYKDVLLDGINDPKELLKRMERGYKRSARLYLLSQAALKKDLKEEAQSEKFSKIFSIVFY